MTFLPNTVALLALIMAAAIGLWAIREERISGWLAPMAPKHVSRHRHGNVEDPYLPRKWDELDAEEVKAAQPISAPPVQTRRRKPVDQLDAQWEWERVADSEEIQALIAVEVEAQFASLQLIDA